MRKLHKAVVGGLGLFCLVSAASLFGRSVWVFELLTHFRVQYVVAGAVLAVALAAGRRWIGAAVATALAIANAAPVLPYLAAPPDRPGDGSSLAARVMAINLRHRFGDVDAAVDLIRAERPDVVVLTELLPSHRVALESLGDVLPYRFDSGGRGIFDILLLSRLPIASLRIHHPASPFLPVVEARLCAEPDGGGACLTVIALHGPRPEIVGGWAQIATFALVAERAAAIADRRVVVLGDLNTTPFSYRFRDLTTRGGLADAALGTSWRTTWISRFPPFGLTLDHVLIGAALRPLARRVARDIGSDHFPLIVDLARSRPATPAR
jgi:endonuclease/exonuclease/phosphatase (EEP) superfamily protein YafD